MSFTFTWDILTTFEIIGIVLAVIGFFNLSEKLETAFGKVRQAFAKIADFEKETAKTFWPLHHNIKPLLWEMIKGLPVLIIIVMAFIIWKNGVWILWDAFSKLTIAGKVLIGLGLIIGLALNELFTQFVITSALGLIAKMLELVFHLMSKPPSGVTGTLGLLMSLICFGLSHIAT